MFLRRIGNTASPSAVGNKNLRNLCPLCMMLIWKTCINEHARKELGWQPKYDFSYILDKLKAGADPRSPLSQQVGAKGYHALNFTEGPYPAE